MKKKLLIALSLSSSLGYSQLSPQGENRVNTYTTNSQLQASVAANPASEGYVVCWTDYTLDGSESGVYAKIYTSGGVSGPAFLVNTYTNSDQMQPAVATTPSGDFIVVWTSYGQDGSGAGIYAQRFNSQGTSIGSEFRVNTATINDQQYPSVASDASGNFIITWASFSQDGDGYGIYAKRFNNDGTANGGEFLVNINQTTGNQQKPVIAMNGDYDFVIAWESVITTGGGEGITTGGTDSDIYAKRFTSSGAQGVEFVVNTTTSNNQTDPSLGIDAVGNFVITWTSEIQDGNGTGIYAQRFNENGTLNGSEFLVNTYTSSNQSHSVVFVASNGDFTVVWDSELQDELTDRGIYAQQYLANGNTSGSEFLVNVYHTGSQQEPALASGSNGDLFFVWESDGQDGSMLGVYMQLFINTTTSSFESLSTERFSICPNPCSKELSIHSEKLAGNQTLEITNSQGVRVLQEDIVLRGNHTIYLDLKPGIYFVQIKNELTQSVKKIVVE